MQLDNDITRFDIDAISSLSAGQPDRLSAIPRRYAMGSFIFKVTAAGAWELITVSRTWYEFGVNDQSSAANTYQQAGVNARAGVKDVYSITNAGRAGALVIGTPGMILGFGLIVLNHPRISATPDGTLDDADWSGTADANYAPPEGGNLGDFESQKTPELLAGALHGSSFSLLPLDQNTSCPLVLGIPQLMSAGIGFVDAGLPNVGDRRPSCRYRLRRPILVPPEVQGTSTSANRFQLTVDYPISTVESVYNSPARPTDTLLALDVMLVVDVARLDAPYNPQTGQIGDPTGYATDYDAALAACYQMKV